MSTDRLKTAWATYKTTQSLDGMSQKELLQLIEAPVAQKGHGLLVNLVMLITFLLVCY